LKPNGQYITWSTIWPITPNDYVNYPTLKDELKEFNDKVQEHIGAFDGNRILQTEEDEPEEDILERMQDGNVCVHDDELNMEDPDTLGFDPLVKAQVILPHIGGDNMATVVGQKRDLDGNLIGSKHCIPSPRQLSWMANGNRSPTTFWLNTS
jgi:hypothetical protein